MAHADAIPQAAATGRDARLALVADWLTRELRIELERLEPASSDASFRRYFRAFGPRGTLIVMDAPPDREDVRPYLKVSALLESLAIHVPHVHECDTERGLLLLEDLGSTQYLSRLRSGGDPEALYADALEALADIQARGAAAAAALEPYDREPLLRELSLMPEWFCARHLGLELTADERELLSESFELIIREALAQPQVFVHRDYHSRNLMVMAARNPGVIDFQDALRGPIGYDLVSLLKDCYISWPRPRVVQWVSAHRARLLARGCTAAASDAELLHWFDLIGVQRHLKVLGIFARLYHRDGKPGYLHDLPLTLAYVLEVCAAHRELAELGRFLELRAAPHLAHANTRGVAAPLARE
ncbi:MAG TPA: phosphotransferase [Steroidobacteraceae bacterium]|nr:phosphotransferase [Steroidobacteraceae bacterium]